MCSVSDSPLLSLRNVGLTYDSIAALNDVNLDFRAGEIHAVVGEHGAGKTSLARIIAGQDRPTEGTVLLRGEPVRIHRLIAARRLGIEVVRQETCLFDSFSIARNILIDKQPGPLRIFNRKRDEATVDAFLSAHNVSLDSRRKVSTLKRSDRVMVDFLKHVFRRPQVLILDETVEQLSSEHLKVVLPMLRSIRNDDGLIIFITHRIDDVYELADRVSIFRDGSLLITEPVQSIDKISLIKLAYTHVSLTPGVKYLEPDIYELLKYNEAILTKLPFALLVTDSRMNVRLMNEAAAALFSSQGSMHINEPLETFIGPRNHVFYETIRSRIETDSDNCFFNVELSLDDDLASKNVNIIPLYDGTYPIGKIITIEDVTEYERLRRQISLTENLSSLGLLAAGVAHEINNPLEIINYYVQNILLTNPDNPEIADSVRDIQEEIVTVSGIIGNLLVFSENRVQLEEKVDVHDLVSTMVRLMGRTFEEKSIRIHYEHQKQPFFVRGVRTELRQVLLNVFRNAYEAMSDGGEIVVKTLSGPGPDSVEGIITITDTGPGIDKSIERDIFVPFYSSKSSPSPNMGLGLSISFSLVRKLGGSLELRNVPAGGCRVTIRLPTVIAQPDREVLEA